MNTTRTLLLLMTTVLFATGCSGNGSALTRDLLEGAEEQRCHELGGAAEFSCLEDMRERHAEERDAVRRHEQEGGNTSTEGSRQY